MQEYDTAIARGRQLIEVYPGTDPAVLRAAWAVVANASLDTSRYVEAEAAYVRLLEITPQDDEARPGVVENLAAAIYKQGEEATVLGDDRAAAEHFLRIRSAAPTSTIRPAAEYDAAAALMRLEDWGQAAAVLESFRSSFPDHDLTRDATRQIAFVYRENGDLANSAAEYVRVAGEADDPGLRREALLEAGDLYEQAGGVAEAMEVYLTYVAEFPSPVETAVETRQKLAGMYKDLADGPAYREQLEAIVEADGTAGEARTPRTRYLAAQAALVLAEHRYELFAGLELRQPFEESLQEKQRRMDALLEALNGLVDYEVAEVTAAATFYIGETYYEFSRALLASERPGDLGPAELQDYEMVLEEEAFPFEELAIEVHEKNLELLVDGLFNPWIERSLGKLADLMPGRYAKLEISPGFLDSMTVYAYRVPGAPETPDPTLAPATAPEPATGVDPGQAGADPASDELEAGGVPEAGPAPDGEPAGEPQSAAGEAGEDDANGG